MALGSNKNNVMMADTGGGGKTTGTKTVVSTAANAAKTATTTPKTKTTTTPKTTTTTPKTTTTTPAGGKKTTVTSADGTVHTAYIVNGRTVNADGSAYNFKNGDTVKTGGGSYTVNNGVGTKVDTPKTTTAKQSAQGVAGKSSTPTTGSVAYADNGTKSTKTSNVNTKPVTSTANPKVPAIKPTTPSTPSTKSTNDVQAAYDAIQAEKNEIAAARNQLQGSGAAPSLPGGYRTEQMLSQQEEAFLSPLLNGGNNNTPTTPQQPKKDTDSQYGSGAGGARSTGGAGGTQPGTQSGGGNQTQTGPAGSTPTTVTRKDGTVVNAYILNGHTVDAQGNPYKFQDGDVVKTGGGDYIWTGDSTNGKGTPMNIYNAIQSVNPSNPPSQLNLTPDDALYGGAKAVPILGPDGQQAGTGYVVNGVTYIKNADGTLSRLTNPTDIPYIVRTGGGDYVMTKDGSMTLDDYEKNYGPLSDWTFDGNGYSNGGGLLPGTPEQEGTARAMTDYSNMTEGDLINYVMNAINVGDEAALRDFMTWAEAQALARERMNPLYNQYIDQSMRNIDLQALRGGFYGQLPTEALRQQALAETEGNRTQAIIDYAQQLINADREGVLADAELNLDERQQRINTLLNLLESNRNMAQADKDRELKKYIADQDNMNAQGKLQSSNDQFERQLAYDKWVQDQKNKQFYDKLAQDKWIAQLRY